MTDVKCNVNNCHHWESNKCTADSIEVDKNTTGSDMEVGRIGDFNENENERANNNITNEGNLGINEDRTNRNNREGENITNLDETEIENAGNTGIEAEAEDTGLKSNRNTDAADTNLENENNENTGLLNNNENLRNKQDMEAGAMGSRTSSQTKCNTFKPENS